jgi:hypothetical protein
MLLSRARRSFGVTMTLAVAVALAACAGRGASTRSRSTKPEVLTILQLQNMLENGEEIGVILSRIDSSGTVYRLTTDTRTNLRASGMPMAVMSKMEITYEHAITVNPELARSDQHWVKIGDYWYGGLPMGWPREWVVGAPEPGELFRRRPE